MSKKMLKRLVTALNTGVVAIGTPVLFNESPLLGGGGTGGLNGGARNAMLLQQAVIPSGATVLIQGHDAIDLPLPGDAGWYTLATLTNASPLQQEIELARWMRPNVTVLTAGAATIDIEGVQ